MQDSYSPEKKAWITKEIVRWLNEQRRLEFRQSDDGSAEFLAQQTWIWLEEMRKFFPLSSPIPDMESLLAAYRLRSAVRSEILSMILEEQIDILESLPVSAVNARYSASKEDRLDLFHEVRKIAKRC